MATFEIDGIEHLQRGLRGAGAAAPKAMASALYIEAERIMRVSRELVPVSSGRLKGSGVVLLPEITPRGASVDFGYGGSAVNGKLVHYAIPVHERTDLNHSVGQAKFLEQPTLEASAGMGERMVVTVRRYLSGWKWKP